VLRVDPKMFARLEGIETDLVARRARAQAEGWRGEFEGIDLACACLHDKRADVPRLNGAPLLTIAHCPAGTSAAGRQPLKGGDGARSRS
jgi:hypothetical protein